MVMGDGGLGLQKELFFNFVKAMKGYGPRGSFPNLGFFIESIGKTKSSF